MSRTGRRHLSEAECARAKQLYHTYDWNTTCELLGIATSTLVALRRRNFRPATRVLRPVPSDFALVADGKTTPWLQKHYRVGPNVLRRWMEQVKTERPRAGNPGFPVPADLAQIAAGKSIKAVAAHYGVHWQTARRWLRTLPPEKPVRNVGWAERYFAGECKHR